VVVVLVYVAKLHATPSIPLPPVLFEIFKKWDRFQAMPSNEDRPILKNIAAHPQTNVADEQVYSSLRQTASSQRAQSSGAKSRCFNLFLKPRRGLGRVELAWQ